MPRIQNEPHTKKRDRTSTRWNPQLHSSRLSLILTINNRIQMEPKTIFYIKEYKYSFQGSRCNQDRLIKDVAEI